MVAILSRPECDIQTMTVGCGDFPKVIGEWSLISPELF